MAPSSSLSFQSVISSWLAFAALVVAPQAWVASSLGAVIVAGLAQPAQAQEQALYRSNISSQPALSVEAAIAEAQYGQWRLGVPVTGLAADSLEIFQTIPFSGWLKADNHRAFAIGTPPSCPYSWRSSGYPTAERAAQEALQFCTEAVIRFNQHQAGNCGCKLAVVDNQVFVEPAELSLPRMAPALWDFGNGTMVAGLLVYERIFGRDNPVQFLDAGGQLRCQGTYSASIALVDNSFRVNCDFAQGTLKGRVGVKNLQSFNPHGEALVQDQSGTKFRLVVAKSILDYLEGK